MACAPTCEGLSVPDNQWFAYNVLLNFPAVIKHFVTRYFVVLSTVFEGELG